MLVSQVFSTCFGPFQTLVFGGKDARITNRLTALYLQNFSVFW